MKFLKWLGKVIGVGLYSLMMALLIAMFVTIFLVAVFTDGGSQPLNNASTTYDSVYDEEFEDLPSWEENPEFYGDFDHNGHIDYFDDYYTPKGL